MIRSKKQGQLIVISGPSGVGKGLVCKELIKIRQNTWLSVSATSREQRPGEIDGENYYFITKDEFTKKIEEDAFLEYAKVFQNNYYGTLKDKVFEKLENGIDVILEIEIIGALKIKEKFSDAIFIFILPPSMEELKRRLCGRGTEDNNKIEERFKRAYIEINEISKYNYVVINDDVNNAVSKVNAILMAEKCRVDRIEEVCLNTTEEDIHEKLVDL